MGLPALSGIDHVHVFVTDRVAAVAWYRRVLGFEPVAALLHWAEGGGPLTVADAGGTVHLALFERPAQPCRSTVALSTTAQGLHAWWSHLRSALPQPPSLEDHGESVSLYLADPDGNPFEITTDEAATARQLLHDQALPRV